MYGEEYMYICIPVTELIEGVEVTFFDAVVCLFFVSNIKKYLDYSDNEYNNLNTFCNSNSSSGTFLGYLQTYLVT